MKHSRFLAWTLLFSSLLFFAACEETMSDKLAGDQDNVLEYDNEADLPSTDGDATDTESTDGDKDTVAELDVVIDGDGIEEESTVEEEIAEEFEEIELEPEDEAESAEPEAETNLGENAGYRHLELIIIQPLIIVQSYDATAELNAEIANRIASGEMNFLMDPQTTTPLIFPYDMIISLGVEGTVVEIPLGETPDTILTLRDATVRGTYSDDFSTIESGVIAGAVSQTDAQAFVLYRQGSYNVTLEMAFNFLGMLPDYDFENGDHGYSFILTYRAEKVVISSNPDR